MFKVLLFISFKSDSIVCQPFAHLFKILRSKITTKLLALLLYALFLESFASDEIGFVFIDHIIYISICLCLGKTHSLFFYQKSSNDINKDFLLEDHQHKLNKLCLRIINLKHIQYVFPTSLGSRNIIILFDDGNISNESLVKYNNLQWVKNIGTVDKN